MPILKPLPALPAVDLTAHSVSTPNDTMNLSELLTELENLSLTALRGLLPAILNLIMQKLLGMIS